MSTEDARIASLVASTVGDPLAPFALRPEKHYVFSHDGASAVAYAIRLGVIVASGDPVGGDHASRVAAIDEFVARAGRHPMAVLGAGEHYLDAWRAHGLRAIPIGRDVVLDTTDFSLSGRSMRNLRQAISRTRNAGITVEIVYEGEIDAALREAILRMERLEGHDHTRGFSMILGRMLDGATPSGVFALARTADGTLCAVHRYLPAGPEDLSLDLPVRGPHAPNGVDERLTIEALAWAREHGYKRMSLAFAPFPDIFSDASPTLSDHPHIKSAARRAAHAFDPLIHAERLYRYLRKYRAFEQERVVLLKPHQVVRVAAALLLLEYGSYGRDAHL